MTNHITAAAARQLIACGEKHDSGSSGNADMFKLVVNIKTSGSQSTGGHAPGRSGGGQYHGRWAAPP